MATIVTEEGPSHVSVVLMYCVQIIASYFKQILLSQMVSICSDTTVQGIARLVIRLSVLPIPGLPGTLVCYM